MILLPWLLVLLVLLTDSFMGRFYLGCLKRGENSKFMVIKSFFVGSIFILILSCVAVLLVSENLLPGEEGALSLLFSIISIIVLCLASNFIFTLSVSFHRNE